ncbi:MAG TPA: integrase arm-type DNA-binding domain-containing protein [Syntrophobacteraceae bacterium]|nr:integrase arm-type DNA-binding domain-containing protein [Syntrophobacteraceae bacterium]
MATDFLADVTVKTAKPKKKDYKLSDGKGLFLHVTESGGKRWLFRYFFAGKEKMISFGTYPDLSLAEARDKRQEARNQVAKGIDPSAERKALKEALAVQAAVIENSFEVVAREWHTQNSVYDPKKKNKVWTPGHAETILSRLERDVFPWLGNKPISEIKPPDILAVLRRVEGRGALESAHRIRTICGQVLRYAVATGLAERDAAADLRGALPPVQENHHAALTEPREVAELLRAIDGYKGTFPVICALKLAPMFFVRPGELRQMEWNEIEFQMLDGSMPRWNVPAEKMKMRLPHIVPLCQQAVAILKELQPLTGNGRYVFPCHRSPHRPMSENAINAALRRMGFTKDDMTGHGFRAMARTILDEVLGVRADYVEHQLAHAVKDPNGRAYNRTTHLVERGKMMQLWADYLDGLKVGAKVIPFKRTA